jgi:hypothetical protein
MTIGKTDEEVATMLVEALSAEQLRLKAAVAEYAGGDRELDKVLSLFLARQIANPRGDELDDAQRHIHENTFDQFYRAFMTKFMKENFANGGANVPCALAWWSLQRVDWEVVHKELRHKFLGHENERP